MMSVKLFTYCDWACNPTAVNAFCEYLWQHGETGDHHGITAGYKPPSFLVSSVSLFPCRPLSVSLPSFSFLSGCLCCLPLFTSSCPQLLCVSCAFFKNSWWCERRPVREIYNPPFSFFSYIFHLNAYLWCRSFPCCCNQKEKESELSMKNDYSWTQSKFLLTLVSLKLLSTPDKFCI